MALVNITNVVVLDNPAPFSNQFAFEITLECIQELQDDLEWKVVYVGSAVDQQDDQVLEEVMVGPVPVGVNRFVLNAQAPDSKRIRNDDLIGVTVLLITCAYKGHKFVQIGYYVNNEYAEPFEPENYPNPVEITKLFRSVLADQPRVTRYAIDWMGSNVPPTDDTEQDAANAMENDEDDAFVKLDQMEEDEEDEDEEEEDGKDNEDVDLEAMEEEDEAEDVEEGEGEGDEGEGEGEEGEGEEEQEEEEEEEEDTDNAHDNALRDDAPVEATYEYQEYYDDENNTMDVGRMIEQ